MSDSGSDQSADVLRPDELHLIFKNLKIEDLYNAVKVSRAWNDIAKKMIIARSVPRMGTWLIKLENGENVRLRMVKERKSREELLNAKPEVNTIFTYGYYCSNPRASTRTRSDFIHFSRIATRAENKPSNASWERPRNQLFKVSMIFVNDDFIDRYGNLGVSISFASIPMLGVTVLYKSSEELLNMDMTDKSICLVVFRYRNDRHDKELISTVQSLKARLENARFSLWGGDISVSSNTFVNPRRSFDRYNQWTALVMPDGTVKSWSFSVSLDSGLDIERKISDVKKKIRLGGKSIALAMGPMKDCSIKKCYNNIAAFRKIFPNVPLTSIFTDHLPYFRASKMLHQFSFDSTVDDSNQAILHTNSLAFLILTWNL